MTNRLVDAMSGREFFVFLVLTTSTLRDERTVDGDCRGIPTKVYVTIGQGSERCKVFKVKSHESILEQSKKYVIRDRFVRSGSRVNSMRAAHRVNEYVYNCKGTRQRKTEERT